MDQISFSQAIEGYLLDANARHLSFHTIRDYMCTFRKFQDYLKDDPLLASIGAEQVRGFLANQDEVSNKTILNYHTGLSALWTWAVSEDLAQQHVVKMIERPKPEQRAIVPFSRGDVEVMLAACGHTRSYARPGKRECRNRRPTAARDRAIILMLLDTGMRASELVELDMDQLDQKNRRIVVKGKGAKERILKISPRTAQALWRYMSQRPEPRGTTTRVFLAEDGSPISRHALRKLIERIGERAGVNGAHPHRFRHTFAIEFLRNGGNGYVLQSLLGHSTMEMVRRYLQLAQQDLDDNHNRASPVDNWGL